MWCQADERPNLGWRKRPARREPELALGGTIGRVAVTAYQRFCEPSRSVAVVSGEYHGEAHPILIAVSGAPGRSPYLGPANQFLRRTTAGRAAPVGAHGFEIFDAAMHAGEGGKLRRARNARVFGGLRPRLSPTPLADYFVQ